MKKRAMAFALLLSLMTQYIISARAETQYDGNFGKFGSANQNITLKELNFKDEKKKSITHIASFSLTTSDEEANSESVFDYENQDFADYESIEFVDGYKNPIKIVEELKVKVKIERINLQWLVTEKEKGLAETLLGEIMPFVEKQFVGQSIKWAIERSQPKVTISAILTSTGYAVGKWAFQEAIKKHYWGHQYRITTYGQLGTEHIFITGEFLDVGWYFRPFPQINGFTGELLGIEWREYTSEGPGYHSNYAEIAKSEAYAHCQSVRGKHLYDSACDPECNDCGLKRTTKQHSFKETCDKCDNDGCNASQPHDYRDIDWTYDDFLWHYRLCRKCHKPETKAHDFEVTVIREATCVKRGHVVYKCDPCKLHNERTTFGEHRWLRLDTKAATCTQDGYVNYACDNCSATKQEPLKATGHKWTLDGIITNPTCTLYGEKRMACLYDSKHKKVDSIDPIGHTPGTYGSIDATCKAEGYSFWKCIWNCGYTKKTAVYPKTENHSWTKWVSIGEMHHSRRCPVCEKTEKQYHDAVNQFICVICGQI